MMKPFRISNLYPKAADLVDWSGVVQLSAQQYDDEIGLAPCAALTYLNDEDDGDEGEIITVGSSFELEQRLLERPCIASLHTGCISENHLSSLHVFDFPLPTHATNPWPKYAIQYPSTDSQINPFVAASSQDQPDAYLSLLKKVNILELEVRWLKAAFVERPVHSTGGLGQTQHASYSPPHTISDLSLNLASPPSDLTPHDRDTNRGLDTGSVSHANYFRFGRCPKPEMVSTEPENTRAQAGSESDNVALQKSRALRNFSYPVQRSDSLSTRAKVMDMDMDMDNSPTTDILGGAPMPGDLISPYSNLPSDPVSLKDPLWEVVRTPWPNADFSPSSNLLRENISLAGKTQSRKSEAPNKVKTSTRGDVVDTALTNSSLAGIPHFSHLARREVDSVWGQTATEVPSSRQDTPKSLLDIEPEAEIARFPTIFQLEEEGRRSVQTKSHTMQQTGKPALRVSRARTVSGRAAAARLLKPFDPAAEGFRFPSGQSVLPHRPTSELRRRNLPLKQTHEVPRPTLWQQFERSDRPAQKRSSNPRAKAALLPNGMNLDQGPSISRSRSLNHSMLPPQPRQNEPALPVDIDQLCATALDEADLSRQGWQPDKIRPKPWSFRAFAPGPLSTERRVRSLYHPNQSSSLFPDPQVARSGTSSLPMWRSRPVSASWQAQAPLEFLSDARFIPVNASPPYARSSMPELVPNVGADSAGSERITHCVRALQASGYTLKSWLRVYAEVCDGDVSKAKVMAEESLRAIQQYRLGEDDSHDPNTLGSVERLLEMGYGAAHREDDLGRLVRESSGVLESVVDILTARSAWDTADWARWRLETPSP